jgi:PAS domain S-box-containing protein
MESNHSLTSADLRKEAEDLIQSISSDTTVDPNTATLIRKLLSHQQALEEQTSRLIQTEKEFQKEREYYKDIFNNQPAGLYRIRVFATNKWEGKRWESSDNPPYIMEFASDRFCEMLGLTRHDFLQNPYKLSDLVHFADKESFVKKNTEANKKFIPFRWEGRLLIRKDIMWIRIESVPRLLDNGDVSWTGILYDITDRKKAEEDLNKTRLQLEDVLEGANVGTLEWNIQTGKIKFNRIWAKNLGYTNTEIKIGLAFLGRRGWKAITHPEDIPYAEEMLTRHFSGELPYHKVEVRMRHKKGHWVWIRQEGRVKTWTPDGKPLLMYGIHSDISNRKQMEEELRINEEKYRILFENNPQPMLIFEPTTLQILEVNQAFLTHYGYSRNEISTMTINNLTPAEDVSITKKILSRTKKKDYYIGVKRHKKKNDEIIYVELKSHTISYHNIPAIHLLINDITEQKRAEQALVELNDKLEERITERTSELMKLNASLQQNEVKFRTVTNFTYDWEYWKSPDNKILFMSPSVERITGYTVEEFEKNPDLIDKIIHESDLEKWENHKKERCANDSGEKRLELSFRVVTKSGEIRWLGHICRCINIDGKHLGTRVSNRDITDKVNAENKLLNITVDVEERERNRFSSELHDGMGPLLSTIKLYFQWLADTDDVDKKTIITEKGNHSIEMAIQTARELARGLNSQFLSDVGYVDALTDFTQRINLTKKINIQFKTNTNERFSGFLELMLYRITTELIKNTITYARATHIEIVFDYNKTKNTIVFAYSDNGEGFDWEAIQKNRKGLGLMNIQQRVQIMKGDISIKSKPGQGMSAFIQFPIKENSEL